MKTTFYSIEVTFSESLDHSWMKGGQWKAKAWFGSFSFIYHSPEKRKVIKKIELIVSYVIGRKPTLNTKNRNILIFWGEGTYIQLKAQDPNSTKTEPSVWGPSRFHHPIFFHSMIQLVFNHTLSKTDKCK